MKVLVLNVTWKRLLRCHMQIHRPWWVLIRCTQAGHFRRTKSENLPESSWKLGITFNLPCMVSLCSPCINRPSRYNSSHKKSGEEAPPQYFCPVVLERFIVSRCACSNVLSNTSDH